MSIINTQQTRQQVEFLTNMQQQVNEATKEICEYIESSKTQNNRPLEELLNRLAYGRLLVAQKLQTPEFSEDGFCRYSYTDPQKRLISHPGETRTPFYGQSAFNLPYQEVSDSLNALVSEIPKSTNIPGRQDPPILLRESSALGHLMRVEYCTFSQEEFRAVLNVKQGGLAQFNNAMKDFDSLLTLKKQDPTKYQNRTEFLAFGSLMKFLREKYPNQYDLSQTTPSFSKITFRFQLYEKDSRMFALTQYVQIKLKLLNNETVTTPFVAIHQDRFLIPETLKAIEICFQEAINNNTALERRIAKIGQIRYLLAHAMPWTRGTAAVGEILETGIFRALGIPSYPYIPQSSVDLKAFSQDLEGFTTWYTKGREEIVRLLPKSTDTAADASPQQRTGPSEDPK